jgi:cytochrome oxidase Cu insertion factor (SCO1/SenC/PrrC family)
MERKRIAEATKGVGKPKVGGPFELIDQKRNPFSSEDMKGKYALVSLSLRDDALISSTRKRRWT